MKVKGLFSSYSLSRSEIDTLSTYLQYEIGNPMVSFLQYTLGDNFLAFMDIMAGTTIKVPSTKTLDKYVRGVQVYLYLKRNYFTNESIYSASKIYKESTSPIRNMAYKVSKTLWEESTFRGEQLDNYLQNIKEKSDCSHKEEDVVVHE